ncbi:gypsy/ty3 retroelement polyprotein [Tanacetum coccineum]
MSEGEVKEENDEVEHRCQFGLEYMFVRTHGTNVTWEVYKKAILARFGNVYEDPMSELKNFKYETTAREYEDAFDSLLSRVEYVPRHKCSGQLYSLVLVPEIGSEGDFLEIDESVVNNGLMDLQEPLISLNALTSTNNFKTMRVIGTVGKHLLHIFIDCGSTHNFLDRNMAKQLGCNIRTTCPLSVTVADGNKLITTSKCKWKFGPHPFSTDVMLLPLGGCDMVLGIQCTKALSKTVKQATLHSMALCIFLDSASTYVFAIPTELPPRREYDHTIPLVEGAQPVNIRPYKHPPSQKESIEELVAELLASGVIKKSTKELIDELHGSQLFTKLDLRFGYHQIRMNNADIAKKTFRTHEGHYEFLVIPFGLTNAPSTFQSLMIKVFKQYLRKFVLVFFDDILIYSQTMKDHVLHLKTVLETMRSHKLYDKRSKYVFGTDKVEYLGHVTSAKGVATDPKKIKAMSDLPIPTNLKQLRGFLGSRGYYRRFIQGYANISKPLTQLLKKNSFVWSDASQAAFVQLKKAMVSALVLQLPNFNKEFKLETDASGVGLGAVLLQEGHPIDFLSKTLSFKHQLMSTYEKEFLAIVYALQK